jgi:predicted anti-sigma-YlaC factor YlaD
VILDRTNFLHWLDQLYNTAATEIDCDQLQAFLPAYVDFEAAGNDPASRLPQVKAHLAQCPDCAEEYEGLRVVARLEAQGRLPQVEESLAQFEAVEAEPEQAPEHKVTVPA